MNPNRIINTGLTGRRNFAILDSTMGQLSDGKWENSPAMRKYWEFAQIRLSGEQVLIEIEDGYGCGFTSMDDQKVLHWFAGKIKQITQDELDGKWSANSEWKRTDKTPLGYLSSSNCAVTVADAYAAYDTLKGRDQKKLLKTAAGQAQRKLAIILKDKQIAAAEQVLAKLQAERKAL